MAHVRLPNSITAALAARAQRDCVTPSEVHRRALAAYLGIKLVDESAAQREQARALRATGLSLAAIGRALGLTRARIHQILAE